MALNKLFSALMTNTFLMLLMRQELTFLRLVVLVLALLVLVN
jgi:hypothetical protein